MKFLQRMINIPLGLLMYLCYRVIPQYAVAIILFTFLTKIILLPISILLQINSVKIVKITPEINRIKVKYFGDSDAIAEKTSEVYKRERYNPFLSTIPILVQLVLLMGLVQIIYNPLTYIYRVDNQVSSSIVKVVADAKGLDAKESSVQMQVVDCIKELDDTSLLDLVSEKYPKADIDKLIKDIKKSNMELFGVSLGRVPVKDGGITILIPLLAALAAWLLCIMQNLINPLQAEQGSLNKYGTMIISVAISLFLGFYVPIGVGFYWIWSNLFTIVQQVVLNMMIDPKKHIDYKELEASKKELEELSNIGSKKKLFEKDPYRSKEKADYKRFFSVVNKHLVVYAEGNGYYKYFKDIIEYILEHSNMTIHYITSDPNDNIFKKAEENNQLRAYYISEKKMITLMMKLECDVFLSSTPDLENYHLKRSYIDKSIEYIFVNHAMNSDNLTLRTHALDHFDTIFCTGKHVVEEQRAIEKLYGLPAKKLVETGYCLLDNMKRDYDAMEKEEHAQKHILIAPSWQKDNIMDTCLDELVESILSKGYKVTVRPHPQYVRIYKEKVESIERKFQQKYGDNFAFEKDFSSNLSVYTADVLITDWSSIAYEYSFTTYKPTLYINTPMKVMNEEYDRIDVVPIDIRVRDSIGASLDLNKVGEAGETVDRLIRDTPKYFDDISKFKENEFFGLGKAAELSGNYILESIKEKIKQKKQSNNGIR
ncbi:MAG: membrane protein insertase YidC [Lachnospiraceae bacterium]|nr:membrane protein insertase YidC [Lachnospiraceae bacterium]